MSFRQSRLASIWQALGFWAVCAGAAQAEWTFVGTSAAGEVYIDPLTMAQRESSRRINQLINLAHPSTSGDRSVREIVDYDCTHQRLNHRETHTFSLPMGEGSITSTEAETDGWTDWSSLDREALGRAVCALEGLAATYTIEPSHTAAIWGVSHLGISTLRGRFDRISGKITLDVRRQIGSVELTIASESVSVGDAKFAERLRQKDFFNVEKFPQILYRGELKNFVAGKPTELRGDLTLLGMSRPVNIELKTFQCLAHPLHKREVCGADAIASFDRTDFGMDALLKTAGRRIDLLIQVEALRD